VTTSEEMTYREAIRAAMWDELASDPMVVLLGEDVADAGGPFKTSEGLVGEFGADRVIDTPICENGFVGVALGMAVMGLRPIVEIMFADFLPTAADGIANELPKFRFMAGGKTSVPVTIRAIGGATARFGAQHSSTGEAMFLGVPALRVVTAATPASAYTQLRTAIRLDDPVLFLEHKALYGRRAVVQRGEVNPAKVIGRANVLRSGTAVTIVATMLMIERALVAADRLGQEGVSVEVLDLAWLAPKDIGTVAESLGRTRRLVVVEEGYRAGGWGSSLIARLAVLGLVLAAPPVHLALEDDLPIAFSPTLEDEMLPSVDQIATALRSVVARSSGGPGVGDPFLARDES
jgi:pyruvate/2-oxoglutarate/acetoin dehydrogenase E1 component